MGSKTSVSLITQLLKVLGILILCVVPGMTAVAQGENAPTTAPGAKDAAVAGDLAQMSLEDLMNVQVTSVSKNKQRMADAPAAIYVIGPDDIARSGFSTIPDLLRLAPGLDVARISSSNWAISARGLNGEFANKLLVLQDGRTLYTPLFGGVYWNTVDYLLPDLDRIEVIRGPGATLWGANAVNGVINITTKDARDTQGLLVESRGAIDGESNLGVRYGGQLDKDTYYRIYGKARYFDEFPLANGDGAGDEWENANGGFRLDRYISDQDSLTFQAGLGASRKDSSENDPIFTPPFVKTVHLEPIDATGNLLARWNHRVDDSSGSTLQIYYDYLNFEDDFYYNQHTFDVDFTDRFMIGSRNAITWGLGYRFVQSEFSPSDTLSFQSSKNDNVYSAFIQDAISLVPDQWTLTLGSKVEHNDYTGFEFQPSAQLMWTPDKKNTVWASVARALQTPTRTSHDMRIVSTRFQQPVGGGVFVPTEVDILGNHDSQSEELIAYELGYRTEPVKHVSVDIAGFYNNYQHLFSLENMTPGPSVPVIIPVQIGNKLHGDTWGGEISSTVEVNSMWRLSGSYSLLESSFGNDQGSTDTTTVETYGGSAPEHQFQLHSYLNITKNIQFNSSLYYVGRVSEFQIPSYFSTDLNLTWQVKDGLEVQVGVENLFDDRHPEFHVDGGSGTSAEVPRTIYAQMAWRF